MDGVNKRPFRILSIDGGGIRGIVPAHIIERIVEKFGIHPSKHFQMIAGTSTGSIIAAALACEVNPKKIVELYKTCGKKIFKRRSTWLPAIPSWLRSSVHSVYVNDELEVLLKEIFGDKKLGELSLPLLLPAADIGNGNVHVFKSGYSHDFTRDHDVLIRSAVIASCSAPTYFDPLRVDHYALSDGGLWANNPGLAATIEAMKRFNIDRSDLRILSLGTGHQKNYYGLKPRKQWGLATGWGIKEFIGFLLSLQSQSAQNYLRLLLTPSQILRLDFESDRPLPLDDCSMIDDLLSIADQKFNHNSAEIKAFLQ